MSRDEGLSKYLTENNETETQHDNGGLAKYLTEQPGVACIALRAVEALRPGPSAGLPR